VILWRLIDLAAKQAREQAIRLGYEANRIESLIRLLVWVCRLGILILAISVTFSHFGINITGLAVFVGVLGLMLSQASEDTLADIMAGVVILLDRPYRVGDRIALLDIDTTGDVVDIGIRSTRILTLDNRMVVFPNSKIGQNMVINSSYPAPPYYASTEIVVAYENDLEHVIQVLTENVQLVEGVQTDPKVDIQLVGFTEYYMRIRIGWWIESYRDLFLMRDRVNRAAIHILRDADVLLPYSKGNVNVQVNSNDEQIP
jgi:small-conductance mechanosensitive channel